MAKHHWTYDKLAKNAYRMNPKTRGPNYPYVPRYEYQSFTDGPNRGQKVIVPFVGTKSLLISLRAWGVTQSSMHQVTLHFSDVDIRTEDPKSSNYFQIQYNGATYWCHKLDRYRNPLTSRCSCRDYFFTWAYYNFLASCLFGAKPRPYKRKTTTRPPRNPHGIIGICKHVYHAWALLRNSGMTVN